MMSKEGSHLRNQSTRTFAEVDTALMHDFEGSRLSGGSNCRCAGSSRRIRIEAEPEDGTQWLHL